MSKTRTLQFWASSLVVLPVFVQAPWVHIHPYSALVFTAFLLGIGIVLGHFFSERFFIIGSLLVGVSGSWLGGCLFWGWLRAYPVWHLPVESIALPVAYLALNTKWRIGAGFYLASLLGTAFTDLMIVITGVMSSWPEVVNSSFNIAAKRLNETALGLLDLEKISLILAAGAAIFFISYLMNQRASLESPYKETWLVASAALSTTLWVDGLFLLTTLIQPQLSGLV